MKEPRSGGPPRPADALLLLVLDDCVVQRHAWASWLRRLAAEQPGLRVMTASSKALAVSERVGRELGLYFPIDGPDEVVRPGADPVRLAEDGRWIEVGGERTDLTRKRSASSILRELVALRRMAPGSVLTTETLFAIGWPDQRVRSKSIAGRVYTAIWTLRSAGLGEALVRTPDGYLLDPAAELAVVAAAPTTVDLKQSPEITAAETAASAPQSHLAETTTRVHDRHDAREPRARSGPGGVRDANGIPGRRRTETDGFHGDGGAGGGGLRSARRR